MGYSPYNLLLLLDDRITICWNCLQTYVKKSKFCFPEFRFWRISIRCWQKRLGNFWAQASQVSDRPKSSLSEDNLPQKLLSLSSEPCRVKTSTITIRKTATAAVAAIMPKWQKARAPWLHLATVLTEKTSFQYLPLVIKNFKNVEIIT